MNRTKTIFLFGGVAVLLAPVICWLMPGPKSPPATRAHVTVPSPPVSAEPAISYQQIEQRDLSVDQISGLSGEQTVGLLSRMTPSERIELGQRLTVLPATSLNNEKIGLFFRVWAKLDPAAAVAWADKQANSDFKDSQMDGVITAWMKTDLPAAAAYAREHLDGTIKSESRVAHAANLLAGQDPKAAIAYIESLPEGTARQFAQTMAAIKWAYNDPVAAAAWVSSLPPAAQGAASASVVAMWVPQDPQAASNWINTLQGDARDSAISAYSANLAPRDPGTALSWAQSIAGDSIRTSTVEALVVQWLSRDRTSASAWINNSQLSVEEKQRLLSSRR